MKKLVYPLLLLLILPVVPPPARAAQSGETFTKTPLLADPHMRALAAEINGRIARDIVAELAQHHRVHGSPGLASAAELVAAKARAFGLEQVNIERIPADGESTYHSLRSHPGWAAESAQLWEVEPRRARIADYDEMRVALANYSRSAEVTAELVDVGAGTSPSDYEGKDVRDKIVLAGGNVAVVHRLACDERGAAGIVSYQQNQTTGWSGEYVDNVRWGHLSPYNANNRFAFMVSLRQARALRDRLSRGERIVLRASVKADFRPGSYDVVTAVIPGSDLADEEIVFSCHLCHQKPGANDNASGAAAILEIGRALVALIRRGEIPRPRRTIRFIWPPEISGTLAYFATHPEIVERMKAAVHLDMVGGNPAITKSVLHVTHTPASLPSAVNTVASVFAEYAIRGSMRAAAGEGMEDGLIQPGGSREALVADVTPYQMGSDHDVFQEGSFRIPTIYLRDWPDVFIHTNNDVVENIDATKMKRSAFIAAASGYFLATAGAREAARLADETFARALARLPKIRERASMLEARGESGAAEARNLIAQSVERDAEALTSVAWLAPDDAELEKKIETLIDQLSGTWLFLTGQFTEQRRGKRIVFTYEPKEPPKESNKKRNSKEAQRPRTTASDASRVPSRKVAGPMNVYYYDYIEDHDNGADTKIIQRIGSLPRGEIILYEILNLVDGKRTVGEIRDYIAAAYELIDVEDVAAYLRLLEKVGVIEFGE